MNIATVIAANRFGLGARPRELTGIDPDPRRWLLDQLAGLASKDLYQDRDLRPTADLRGLFKGILIDHLGLPAALVERQVFPGSSVAKPMRDLIRV